MKRHLEIIKFVFIYLFLICLVSAFLVITYFITKAIYTKLSWQPQELVAQIINSILGIILSGITIRLVSSFLFKGRREHPLWKEVINAINKISKGDFNVNLEKLNKQNHPFIELIDGINNMAANLKAMEEMRQEFISNISHEIGSPLTSIRGFASALKNENLSFEQRKHYLDIIENECIRLSKLSENLLRLTMLDSEQYPLHLTTYRLDKQIQLTILEFEPQWSEKELDITLSLDEIIITADQDLLKQVWQNLIDNAIKFTLKGGAIKIQLYKKETYAIVTISDTGIGISEQDLPRIFERFFKADKSRNRAVSGSGLGLSIVKKIVELHNGKIFVNSQLGKGTEFIIQLPLNVKKHRK
ncbi:integral membrane sensor signal transduction histidine kinase [Caldicellulosiruptor hydrothermalis 108]|uniref:Heme sensor protein HssS n=1 Tax=Caldicellulosiruptor hydrothermalis (strain DSM 18901 / VKM B-2411 / 108) TaxID=632292 RepID=E4QAK6_CALH1|nr:HAMP domain-containing sensor histidine kinase [Caldicellulosiruptor hydrothermalis]ADQ05931.1 integral membrane sensor signal transduction histidine kinase [Caldicellulosiruptor hydrothermalis 108]